MNAADIVPAPEWRCRCGHPVMLADTEDWADPCCFNCFLRRTRHGTLHLDATTETDP